MRFWKLCGNKHRREGRKVQFLDKLFKVLVVSTKGAQFSVVLVNPLQEGRSRQYCNVVCVLIRSLRIDTPALIHGMGHASRSNSAKPRLVLIGLDSLLSGVFHTGETT